MLIGYARVSTPEQSLNLQRDALKKAGCRKIFTDVASGAKAERAGLEKAIEFARSGDTIVVWKLDRFGRSLAHLIESVRKLQARKVGFRTSALGKTDPPLLTKTDPACNEGTVASEARAPKAT